MRTSVAFPAVPSQSATNTYSRSQSSTSPKMSMKEKIITTAILFAFAIIHVFAANAIDGTRAINESYGSAAETAHMYWAD